MNTLFIPPSPLPSGPLLAVMLLAPLAGAAFSLVLPAEDRLTLRATGVLTGLVALAAGIVLALQGGGAATVPIVDLPLSFSGPTIPAALTILGVTPMALRAGAPRVRVGLPAYVVAVLTSEALALWAVLVPPSAAVAAATVAAVPPFALVALFGGPLRGSVTFRAAALWLLVDAAGLAGAVLSPHVTGEGRVLVVLAILGPGLVRLAAGPWGLWALAVMEQAPVSAACLVGSAVAPVGAVLVTRALPLDGVDIVLPVLAGVFAVASGIGAVLVVAERDLRRIVAHLLGLLGALSALGLLVRGTAVIATVLVGLTGFAAAFALMMGEAVERRLETRRIVELAGLALVAPPLAVLLPLALLTLCGLPVLGVGIVAWDLCGALLRHPAAAVGVAAACQGGALLVAGVGVAVVAGRVVLPHRRKKTHEIRVSFSQGVRLLIPLAALGLASISARTLITLAEAR